jgi:hypothetical protein
MKIRPSEELEKEVQQEIASAKASNEPPKNINEIIQAHKVEEEEEEKEDED